jgi:hypothetical protein
MNELIDRMTEAGHEWTEAREKLRRHGTYAYGLIVAAHAQGIPETRIAALMKCDRMTVRRALGKR